MKSEGAKKMDTKKILESLTDMGCDEKEISFMKKMYEEGDTDTMDELHDSQKKVDNMDFLIRQIQKEK